MSVYNFCAGPAMLPPDVMKKAQKEFINWQNLGVSVMEVSHRSAPFLELAHKSEESLRRLMNISDDYVILFMHGGGRGQFSAVPLNLHQEGKQAIYCQTGTWSSSALDEANKFTQTQKFNIRNDQGSIASVIPVDQWQLPAEASYIHYCTNETVDGIELFDVPKHSTAPIVADMSSNILSRQIDINQFDLIYAGAQKNIGPSGLAIVIVKKDLLSRPGLAKPGVFDYALEAKQQSMFNTPPTFAWYLAAEVFTWLEQNGGVEMMEAHNRDKAALLYDFIDNSDFYKNNIDTSCRSLMNVPFLLKNEYLNKAFLTQSQNMGLLALEGHRSVGGMRASIYNAMPKSGVESLVDFMHKFSKENT